MPVIRTFIAKVKPGRTQDVIPHLSTYKSVLLESGATDFNAYHIITGPVFPGLAIHAVFEDLSAWGAGREKVLQRPELAQLTSADAPIDILHALIAEPVYVAGNVESIIAQTKVRYRIGFKPHRGRGDTVVRRLSRLADTAHQCGALAVAVRRAIAGTDGPQIGIIGYYAGFAELQATRNAVLESDVWTALSRNQDEAATRLFSNITTKIDL
jgi:hypothetical protein